MNGPSFDRRKPSSNSAAVPKGIDAYSELRLATEEVDISGDVQAEWTLIKGPNNYQVFSRGYLTGVLFAPSTPGAVVFVCNWATAVQEVDSIIRELLPKSGAEIREVRLFLGGMRGLHLKTANEFVGGPFPTTVESDQREILRKFRAVGLGDDQLFVRWETQAIDQSIIIDPDARVVWYSEIPHEEFIGPEE